MSGPWAVRCNRNQFDSLVQLRLLPEIEAACDDEDCWLRGPRLTENLRRKLLSLPCGELFEVQANGHLRLHTQLLPNGRLPDLDWKPLMEWIEPVLPAGGLAGYPPRPVLLRLVRSTEEMPSNLLSLPFPRFAPWCLSAPEIRLQQLRFAVRSDGRCLVHGLPLPPLIGERYVERRGVAVPAGFHWSPAVDVETIRRILELSPQDLCLWSSADDLQRISNDDFVGCRRSAIRATMRHLNHESQEYGGSV